MEARIQLRFLGYMGKLCIYLKIRFNCAKVFGCGYLGVQQNKLKILFTRVHKFGQEIVFGFFTEIDDPGRSC